MTVVLVASTCQLWIWNHRHWITPLGSLVLPLRHREQQGHPRKTSSDFSILEVHNLCRDDEVILHVLVRCNPQVFSNKSLRKIAKFRPSKPPTCRRNELWWTRSWQNAPFVIHCLENPKGWSKHVMMWIETILLESQLLWCLHGLHFCKVQCNLWSMIHSPAQVAFESESCFASASFQTTPVQLAMNDCSNHLKTALLCNSVAQSVRQGTTLDAQSVCGSGPGKGPGKGPFASGRDVPVEEFPNDEKHQCANLRFQNFRCQSAGFGLIYPYLVFNYIDV